MPTFTPVDHDPFAAASASGPRFIPVDHDPFAETPGRQVSMPQYDAAGSPTGMSEMVDATMSSPRSAAVAQSDDILKGIGGGLVRGTAGAVGLVTDTLPSGLNWFSDAVSRRITGQTADEQQAEQRAFAQSLPGGIRNTAGAIVNAGKTETLQHGIEHFTGEAYEPTTRAGKIVSRAAEFSRAP
jgi:hypothetical protein